MSTFTNDVDMLNQAFEQRGDTTNYCISNNCCWNLYYDVIFKSPPLTIVVVIMLVVMLIFTKYSWEKDQQSIFVLNKLALADMNGYIEEMMSGQKVVKVFNYEERAINTFDKKKEDNFVRQVVVQLLMVLCFFL